MNKIERLVWRKKYCRAEDVTKLEIENTNLKKRIVKLEKLQQNNLYVHNPRDVNYDRRTGC